MCRAPGLLSGSDDEGMWFLRERPRGLVGRDKVVLTQGCSPAERENSAEHTLGVQWGDLRCMRHSCAGPENASKGQNYSNSSHRAAFHDFHFLISWLCWNQLGRLRAACTIDDRLVALGHSAKHELKIFHFKIRATTSARIYWRDGIN